LARGTYLASAGPVNGKVRIAAIECRLIRAGERPKAVVEIVPSRAAVAGRPLPDAARLTTASPLFHRLAGLGHEGTVDVADRIAENLEWLYSPDILDGAFRMTASEHAIIDSPHEMGCETQE
jgi:hypothetical protein